MIVVAIIGILAAVAIPAYSNYTKKAKFTEVTQATQAMKSALEACQSDTNDLTLCPNNSNGVPAEIGVRSATASVAANTTAASANVTAPNTFTGTGVTTAGLAANALGKYVNEVSVVILDSTHAAILAKAATVNGLSGETYQLDGTFTPGTGFAWQTDTASTCLTATICK
jgi:type IV pilus assembly protein PilA